MAARGMGAATKGGGCVEKTGGRHGMEKRTSRTTGPVMMKEGGEVGNSQVYEVLGQRVTKEQYDEAAKKMDTPQSDVERSMDDFAQRAKARAKNNPVSGGVPPLKKKKGGAINLHKKMAMGKKRKK